jgi:hypothetical protein
LEKIMSSKSRSLVVTALVVSGISAAVVACAERTDDASSSAAAQTQVDGGRYVGSLNPPPGTTDNALDVDLVLTAWKKVKADFYDSAQGYTHNPNSAPPPASELNRCMTNCYIITYYSDLVCHYYCSHPSYEQVSPNVRGCFSYLANGATASGVAVMRKDPVTQQERPLYYPEIYDYCLYAEKDGKGYDAVLNPTAPPPWDEAIINANKAAGRKIGVLKWVDENEAKAFKYVMYTWYNPFAFKLEDQEKAINAFYGVTLANPNYTAADTADVAECNAKRPVAAHDPTDGTHCSATKVFPYPRANHRNYAAIDAYMQTL